MASSITMESIAEKKTGFLKHPVEIFQNVQVHSQGTSSHYESGRRLSLFILTLTRTPKAT